MSYPWQPMPQNTCGSCPPAEIFTSRGVAAIGILLAKLEKAQLSYSAFNRELYSVYAAIRHFRHQAFPPSGMLQIHNLD